MFLWSFTNIFIVAKLEDEGTTNTYWIEDWKVCLLSQHIQKAAYARIAISNEPILTVTLYIWKRNKIWWHLHWRQSLRFCKSCYTVERHKWDDTYDLIYFLTLNSIAVGIPLFTEVVSIAIVYNAHMMSTTVMTWVYSWVTGCAIKKPTYYTEVEPHLEKEKDRLFKTIETLFQ